MSRLPHSGTENVGAWRATGYQLTGVRIKNGIAKGRKCASLAQVATARIRTKRRIHRSRAAESGSAFVQIEKVLIKRKGCRVVSSDVSDNRIGKSLVRNKHLSAGS